jgi:hypothetical protein
MLMATLFVAIFTSKVLYSFKTHLDGDNIETQQVLMFFKFLLPLHSGRLANLLALKACLELWVKQLYIPTSNV